MAKRLELLKEIKEYILDCDNKQELVSELKRYKKEFKYELDYNYYQYGNCLIYTSDIFDLYEKHGYKIKNYNNVEIESLYKSHVRRAINQIIREGV